MEENTSKALVDPTAEVFGALVTSTNEGSSLFVINLCASMAPVVTANKSLPGLEQYKLYQVARNEDGRTRHRLRLGFFPTEAEAEAVLASVRQQYPTAFTTCLCEEDRRFARGYLPTESAAVKRPVAAVPVKPPPAAVKSAPQPAPAPVASKSIAPKASPPPAKPAAAAPKPPQKPAPARVEEIEISWEPPAKAAKAPSISDITGLSALDSWDAEGTAASKPSAKSSAAPQRSTSVTEKTSPAPDTSMSQRVRALDLSLLDPPAPTPKTPARAPNEPFHVGKGVEIPSLALSLESEGASAHKPAARPAAQTSKNLSKPASAPAPAKAGPHPAARKPEPANPDLDSTQTIRALTTAELNDDAQEKFFAIQLAASEQPVNLEAMPHLDIFEAYRVYSVATAGSGKIVHSLRLGFFKEAVSAEAVCGYLKTFFPSPSVLRVSLAEHTRFKDATLPKRNARPESSAAPKVVELNAGRSSKPVVPTVMEVVPSPKVDTSATGSFDLSNSGSFRPNATGSFATSATGTYKSLAKPAAKTAAPATKRSAPLTKSKTSASGKHKALQKKSLAEELLDEARQVELSESAIRKLPKNDSLLSRLVDKLKK